MTSSPGNVVNNPAKSGFFHQSPLNAGPKAAIIADRDGGPAFALTLCIAWNYASHPAFRIIGKDTHCDADSEPRKSS
jgi:hypothetical protein